MQEEVADGTATVVEPKQEVVECNHDYDTTHLTSKVVKDDNSLHVQIKEEIDFNLQEVEKNSELVIIDTVKYNPSEFPTPEDDNIIPILEDVEKNINERATNNTTNTHFPSKILDEKRRKLLEDLESRIVKDNLNISKLPADIWKTLKEFTWSQRRKFQKNVEKKLEDRNKQNEEPSKQPQPGGITKQDVINNLTSSFTQWLSEQWSAMEGNTESEENTKINLNTKQCFTTETEKHQFMKNMEQMVDSGMLDVNKTLPPEVDNCMVKLPKAERKRFRAELRERQARRLSDEPALKINLNTKQRFTTETEKHEFMKNIEQMVDSGMLDVNKKLPPELEKCMVKLPKGERKRFRAELRERQARRSSDERASNPSAMEGNFKSEEKLKINLNTKQCLTETEKHQFMKNAEQMVDSGILDMNKPLPPEVWNCMIKLTRGEQIRFKRALRERQARRSSGGPASNPSAMEGNFQCEENLKINSNTVQPFTETQKLQFFSIIEKMIDCRMINIRNLPPEVWDRLKQLPDSKQFIEAMKKKQAAMRSSGEAELNLSALLGNFKSEENLKINSNTFQPLTETQKLQFFDIIEKMIDCDMININKLPVEVWDRLKQLPEKKQFIQAMREKQATRWSSGGLTSFISLFNSPTKTDFRETNQASHSQSKSNEKPNSNNKLYSFDMDFNNQKLGKSSIATTSTLSQYNSYNQATSMNRNPAYSSVSSYPSFNANIQTPNSAAFSSYDRDGASQPSYASTTSLYSSGVCRSENGSKIQAIPNQSLYNNPSKRKLPAFSSYNEPQQKRSNTKFDKPNIEPKHKSILAAIYDVNDQKGKMNGARAALLSNMLIRRLGEPSLSATGFVPRFHNSGLNSDGVFTINCVDQKSFDWLSAMVSGSKFHVTKYVKYSERVQVTLFIANGGVVETSATIIPRIKLQNPGLTTESWKVLKQTVTPAGQVFLLSIDVSSEQLLKTMNYNVYLGLSSVKCKPTQYTF